MKVVSYELANIFYVRVLFGFTTVVPHSSSCIEFSQMYEGKKAFILLY